MTKPKQRVVIYRHGLRPKTALERKNDWLLKQPGYFQCPRCGRAVKKGDNGNLKRHFSNYELRIKCPAGIDPITKGGVPGPRKKYRVRDRVIDIPRKPVESLYNGGLFIKDCP